MSNPRGLNQADEAALLQVMVDTAAENVGMASVFAVMQAAKDWIDAKAGLVEGASYLSRVFLTTKGFTLFAVNGHGCCCAQCL